MIVVCLKSFKKVKVNFVYEMRKSHAHFIIGDLQTNNFILAIEKSLFDDYFKIINPIEFIKSCFDKKTKK